MLTLQEVKQAVEHFSAEELLELRAYLDAQSNVASTLQAGTMDINALLAAARALRDGIPDEEWQEIEKAMNEEYIQPVDADGFPIL